MKANYAFILALSMLLAFSSCKKEDRSPSSDLENTSWILQSVAVFGDERQGFIKSWGNQKGETFDELREDIRLYFGSYAHSGGHCTGLHRRLYPNYEWSEFRPLFKSNYATVDGFLLKFERIKGEIPDYNIELIGAYIMGESWLSISYKKEMETSEKLVDALKKLNKSLLSNEGREGHNLRESLRNLELLKDKTLREKLVDTEKKSNGFRMYFQRQQL